MRLNGLSKIMLEKLAIYSSDLKLQFCTIFSLSDGCSNNVYNAGTYISVKCCLWRLSMLIIEVVQVVIIRLETNNLLGLWTNTKYSADDYTEYSTKSIRP